MLKGNYDAAVDHIISAYQSEFQLSSKITWNRKFLDGVSSFKTDDVGSQVWDNGKLTLYTYFGKDQFVSFKCGDESFGDLVRNIFHEHEHVENAFNYHGRLESHADEFLAHFNTLTNTTLPGYSTKAGQGYIKSAEGYFNYIPQSERTPQIMANYGHLVYITKPQFGMPAVKNPNQLPPQYFKRDANGKVTGPFY